MLDSPVKWLSNIQANSKSLSYALQDLCHGVRKVNKEITSRTTITKPITNELMILKGLQKSVVKDSLHNLEEHGCYRYWPVS